MSAPKRILLVDDDQQLRQALAEQLTGDFVPVEAGTGSEGLATQARHLRNQFRSNVSEV